jgi:hypothetical protein
VLGDWALGAGDHLLLTSLCILLLVLLHITISSGGGEE